MMLTDTDHSLTLRRKVGDLAGLDVGPLANSCVELTEEASIAISDGQDSAAGCTWPNPDK